MPSGLLFITSPDCHLCERGHKLLAELGLETREIDVGSREAQALAARGLPLIFLPVLTDGERVIARSRFSSKRVRKELSL